MRPDVEPAAFGALTKFAPSTIRHVLDGQREASLEVESELERVLALAARGDVFPQGADPVVITERKSEGAAQVRRQRDFYYTETVRRIGEVLSYCADFAAIGVVTADYGVGKSESVKAWRRGDGRRVESVVFEFDSFSSSNRVDFVESVADLLGVDYTPGHHNGGKTLRALVAHLRQSPVLLILDQCEMVRPAVMQVARQIWDGARDAGVGMVLLAAPVLMERMLASRTRDLGALSSRVGVWARLGGLARGEVAAILKKEGIAGLDDDTFALLYQAVGGSMRRLMASVDMLRARHVAKGRAVNTETIEGIAAHLWGMAIGRAA
jgi:type II secretory pathway predicted ATPase ExeA